MPAVQDWLASFANAKFVVTDSFHGMVFSIVFGKPFLAIANKQRGAARFESLLSKLGGLNHLIYETKEINSDQVKNIKPLNKEKLNKLKIGSLFFLENSVIS